MAEEKGTANDQPNRAEPFQKKSTAIVEETNITRQGAQVTERNENARIRSQYNNPVTLDDEERPYEEVPSEDSNDKEPTLYNDPKDIEKSELSKDEPKAQQKKQTASPSKKENKDDDKS